LLSIKKAPKLPAYPLNLTKYDSLQQMTMLVTVEHCGNCKSHTSLSHEAERYVNEADMILGYIEEVINNENDLLHLKIIKTPEDFKFKIDEFGFKIEMTKIGISSPCYCEEISSRGSASPRRTRVTSRPSSPSSKQPIADPMQLVILPSGQNVNPLIKENALAFCDKTFSAATANVHKIEVAKRSRLGPRRIKTGGNTKVSKDEKGKSRNALQVRIGAFEVQIAFLHPKYGLMIETLHSKLVAKSWPNKELVKRRAIAFYDKVVKAHLKSEIVGEVGS